MDQVLSRVQMVRPITVAIALTITGEIIYFLLWGVVWFPEGDLWRKLGWTATCGLAMGATIGALVLLFVTGRFTGRRALAAAGAVYAGTLLYCTALCFLIARSVDYFGANSDPSLFVGGSVVPIVLTTVIYAWLVTSVFNLSCR